MSYNSRLLLQTVYYLNAFQDNKVVIGLSVLKDFQPEITLTVNKSSIQLTPQQWKIIVSLKKSLQDYIFNNPSFCATEFNALNINLDENSIIKLTNHNSDKYVCIKNSIQNFKMDTNTLEGLLNREILITHYLDVLHNLEFKRCYTYYLHNVILTTRNNEMINVLLNSVSSKTILQGLLEMLWFYKHEVEKSCKLITLFKNR